MNITTEIKAKVIVRLAELLEKHNERFPDKAMTMPFISFNLKGATAGKANYMQYRINLNPVLLIENEYDFIKNTVAHEFAHLVADHHTNQLAKSHGKEWKFFMRFFGVEPSTYHNYTVPGRIKYKCDCMTHQLSKRIHNKILRGATYNCNKCKFSIELVK